MKDSRKYKIYEAVILILWFVILGILAKKLDSECLEQTPFLVILCIISIVFIVLVSLCDNKLKKIKEEENKIEEAKEKEESKKKLIERSQINNITNLMYELYFGNNLTINELLNRYDLEMDYMYDDEEDEDWFEIVSKVYKKKLFYSLSLTTNGTLYLEKEELNVSSKTYDEIIELMAKDINDFFNKEA
jgi:hypothetical protein